MFDFQFKECVIYKKDIVDTHKAKSTKWYTIVASGEYEYYDVDTNKVVKKFLKAGDKIKDPKWLIGEHCNATLKSLVIDEK